MSLNIVEGPYLRDILEQPRALARDASPPRGVAGRSRRVARRLAAGALPAAWC